MVRSVGDIKNEEDGIKATCDCELEFEFFVVISDQADDCFSLPLPLPA